MYAGVKVSSASRQGYAGREHATFVAGVKAPLLRQGARCSREHATFCADVKEGAAETTRLCCRDHATFSAGVKGIRNQLHERPVANTRHSLQASRHLPCGKALNAVANTRHSPRVARKLAQGPKRPLIAITRHSARTSRRPQVGIMHYTVANTRHFPQASRARSEAYPYFTVAITRHSEQASRLFSFFRTPAVYYVAITRHFPRGSLSADPAIVAHRKRGRCVASAPTREHAKYLCHLESRTRDIHRGRQGVPSKTADYAQVAITRHFPWASRGYGTLTARSPIANTRHLLRSSRFSSITRSHIVWSRLRDIYCGHQGDGALLASQAVSRSRDILRGRQGCAPVFPLRHGDTPNPSREKPLRTNLSAALRGRFSRGSPSAGSDIVAHRRRGRCVAHASTAGTASNTAALSLIPAEIKEKDAASRAVRTKTARFRYRRREAHRSPTPSGRANVATTRHSSGHQENTEH